MRKMIDSGVEWLGDIPETWDLVQLGSLFSEHKNKNTGMQSSNLLSLSYGNIIRKDINTSDGLLPESFEGYNVIDEGDIVLRLTDLQNDQRSLRVGLSHERGIVTSAYITLRKRNPAMNSQFFYYLIHSYDVCKGFYGMGAGVRQGLNFAGVRKIMLTLPPTDEQMSIADFLEKKVPQVDALIANVQAQIEKLKAYKQSVITEVVTKGLNPNVPMKDSGVEWIGEIPEHWDYLKSFFAYDKIGDIDHYMPESVADGYTYVMTGDLKRTVSEIDFEQCKKVSEKDYQHLSKKIVACEGDVIFARYATIGTACYVDIDEYFLVSYSCVTIKPKRSVVDGKYLWYYYQSLAFLEDVKKLINANTQSNVGMESLYRAKLVIPPLTEQQELIAHLDRKCAKIDRLIAIKQAKIEKLEQYKRSLIYEYVTGKKEVSAHT